MAKEKTDAASLFDGMNKNRKKMTNEVNKTAKKKKPTEGENFAVNQEESPEIEESSNEETVSEDVKYTDSVDNFEEINNITGDIKEKKGENTSDEADQTKMTADEVGSGSEITDEKGKKLQHIHIALPIDVYEKLEIAKKAYYNNKTTYIRNLILDDYEKNKDYYDRLPNIR